MPSVYNRRSSKARTQLKESDALADRTLTSRAAVRRRPKLSHKTVEKLHIVAWALGLTDVVLVAVTIIFK